MFKLEEKESIVQQQDLEFNGPRAETQQRLEGIRSEGYEGTVYSHDTSIDTPSDSDSEMSWRVIESVRDMPVVPLLIRGWRQQVGAFEQEDPAAVDDEQLDPGDEERSDDE
jgi:hypothetical protein